MSASPRDSASATNHMKRLEDIEVAKISRNPMNPRIHFTPEEIARLTESIDRKGVLVPVVVYEQDGGYILTDGERRWRCARSLGLDLIPAVITEPPDAQENLVQMFNIHMVREAWRDMPTAWALGRVVDELGVESDSELADMTGLSIERIKRLRHALQLPTQYQKYIDEGTIPLNFFWELKRYVIEPMAKKRPALSDEFGPDGILDAFVAKRLNGVVTDVVSLRLVTPIINYAAAEVDDIEDASPLDDTLRQLVTNESTSISDAYEDTVQVFFEADKLTRRAENMVKSFRRLLGKAKDSKERQYVRNVGHQLMRELAAVIDP